MNNTPLLTVSDLSVHFRSRAGTVQAVDQVSFEVRAGEIVGLVGESGSGKSTVGRALLRLLPEAGEIVGGRVCYNGQDLLKLSTTAMQRLRGCEIAMTFQDPMTFLNPVMRIGDQIVEVIRQHEQVSFARAWERSLEWIANVRITEPERVARSYPHQLSGGMRQRILIAIALAGEPSLIIADEPTTALDVTIQREIIDLLISIRDRFKTAILLITHDLGVVAELCDRVYVMYGGQVFEHADIHSIIATPQNPYTRALLRSARSIDEFHPTLYAISGTAPSLVNPAPGCRFTNRCPSTFSRCVDEPPTFPTGASGWSKCWLHAGEGADQC
jgi:oligopeptide/dipeptide ABC transporter ATP-binding protein